MDNLAMKMSLTLFLLSVSLAIHTANAFNITTILDKYPDYSTFNSYLTQTNLASEINSRQTITILAVDNGNIASLAGKQSPLLKHILSVHVVLDYYDMAKLQQLSKTSVLLTTLFQSTGLAQNHQGFLNVTKLGSDSIAMGSAVPGSPLGTNLVKAIAAQPYNISVLQVSNVIVPPGIDGAASRPTAPPQPPTSSQSAPPTSSPPAPPTSSPPSPPTPPPKSARPPSPSRARPPAPTTSEASDLSPMEDSPLLNGPTVADGPIFADAPDADDKPEADTPPSGARILQVGLAVVVTMVLSTFYLASRI